MSPAPTAQYTAVRLGRHRQQRFPISTPVKYIVGKVAGEGVTCNIGSDSLLMKTSQTYLKFPDQPHSAIRRTG